MTASGVRVARRTHRTAIEAVYAAAFDDEAVRPVARRLLAAPHRALSLIAVERGRPVGHIAFTRCRVAGRADAAMLLGPLAVRPERQRLGVGGALIRAGLRRIATAGGVVFVLGDPAYYRRFGFAREDRIAPPYPLPGDWAEAWRSIRFTPNAPFGGPLIVPQPWRDPRLWSD